ASTLAASAPNAPEAPVTIAVLPRMSNSESGFLKKSSGMMGMTPSASLRRRRHGDQHGDHVVAAVDDLAALVRPDETAVVRLEHPLLAARDHGQLAGKHHVDLLGGRGIRPGAAAGEEMREPDQELFGAASVGTEQAQR